MMRRALAHVVGHPANTGLRRYLEPGHQSPAGLATVVLPDDVERPYYELGTHPDLVARLWDELGQVLPRDCRAIFFGRPVLIHPETGVVFAFAVGTHTYALRLPQPERREALGGGAPRIKHYPGEPSLDVSDIGEEWVFCGWNSAEERWCRAAYEHAGAPSRRSGG